MIALYLLLQLIIHCSISETNLDAHHAEHIIIMKKNFMHVCYMSFLLSAFDKDSDQTFNLTANKIISHYNHNQETSELIITQKNRINIILIIHNLEYIIYYTDLSLHALTNEQ